MKVKIHKITLPEYNVKKMPDYHHIGRQIDAVLKKHFLNQKLAIRCVGTSEHKGKTVDELIKIIKKTGTDRYNSKREGQKYKNISKKIDLFALERTVTTKAKIMWQFICLYTKSLTYAILPLQVL